MLDETAPLLGVQPKKKKSRWSSIYWLCIVVLCLSASGSILNIPLTELVENNICTRYSQQPALADCKTSEIQSRLAYLMGNLSLVEAVVGLFVAFPFGTLADRIGRKPVIFLSVIGSSLSVAWELAVTAFPNLIHVQAILAGPLFTIIGGGNTVLLANLYSIASDLVDESDRASAFLFMAFSSLVGASLGPALSAELMEHSTTWIAAIAGFLINLCSLIPLLFVPETLSTAKAIPEADANRDDDDPEEPQSRSFKSHLSQTFTLLASFSALKSPSLLLVLATFLTVAPEILGTSQFMAQYISKRFGWPLAKTGYLLTLRGVIHLSVLLVILPSLSKLLLRYRSPATKDLILARGSIAFAGIGALLMAAPQIGILMGGLAVHSLGSGLAPLCRSLATGYVAQQDASKLNTMIGMVEMAGSLFAGPLLAWLFDTGMRLGGISFGLPYFGLAGSFALCLLGLCFVKSPAVEEAEDSD